MAEQKLTQGTTQKLLQHHDATDIQTNYIFVFFGRSSTQLNKHLFMNCFVMKTLGRIRFQLIEENSNHYQCHFENGETFVLYLNVNLYIFEFKFKFYEIKCHMKQSSSKCICLVEIWKQFAYKLAKGLRYFLFYRQYSSPPTFQNEANCYFNNIKND